MEENSTSHRAMFAIWHWPRWVWGVALPIALAAYLLSAAPVVYCVYRSGLVKNGLVVNTYRVVYFPVS